MTDPVFDAAVAAVLEHEGGLVDDPGDPGGITNMGISLRSYPQLGADGIRALTLAKAKAIYFTDFWLRCRINRLPGATIPAKVLDTAILAGPVPAIELLQRALVALGCVLAVDGRIGAVTVNACQAVAPPVLLAKYDALLVAHYQAIVAAHPDQARFLRGWTARALA